MHNDGSVDWWSAASVSVSGSVSGASASRAAAKAAPKDASDDRSTTTMRRGAWPPRAPQCPAAGDAAPADRREDRPGPQAGACPAVRALQEALVRLGFDVPGGADGSFGAGTTRAIKELQAQCGLTADVRRRGMLRAVDARLDRASNS
jgi:peptidoglycan hydrolase-like protein with peptidoglycan-binding domain